MKPANRCPITYELTEGVYSSAGLRGLSRSLAGLEAFPYSADAQVREAAKRMWKMSIQGVQPKLSARLNVKKRTFEVVDINGRFILKPQNNLYPELPENEDVSMKMAKAANIETPFHGLVYSMDNSLTYFIKRFDRLGGNKKLQVEDFSQLIGESRDTKYDSSMEKVVKVIDEFCTFPALERTKLFRLTIFNYLIGNEDMHLKNFSLINRKGRTELSPAYDLLNTSIAIGNPVEEIALPLAGKRSKLSKQLLFDYFGKESLTLTDKAIDGIAGEIAGAFSEWDRLIDACFLSERMKREYKELLKRRRDVLGI